MTRFPASSSSERSIFAALELSENGWLLAIQVPGRDNPGPVPIRGGHAEGLMAKLDGARKRGAKVSARTPKVALCDEAGIGPIPRSVRVPARSFVASRIGAAGYNTKGP